MTRHPGAGGVFFNGTIDRNSFTYNSATQTLGFNYASADTGGLAKGVIGSVSPWGASGNQGLLTLSLAGQMAQPWGNVAGVTFGVFAAFVAPEALIPEEAAAAGLGLGGTAVIGKMADIAPELLGPGERTLDLPYLENPQADAVQNSQKLRLEMREGRPIKDATALKYSNDPNKFNTGYLRLERNILRNHGWTYSNGYWFPPQR